MKIKTFQLFILHPSYFILPVTSPDFSPANFIALHLPLGRRICFTKVENWVSDPKGFAK